MKPYRLMCQGLLLSWLGGYPWSAPAQPRQVIQAPDGFSLRLADSYLRTDVEMEQQIQEAGNVSVTRERLLVQPAVGLALAGWAYHPNLLEYTLQSELGLDWQDARIDPGREATDSRFLQRYHAAAQVLQQKPYALALFADKDMTYRDYDFFSRVRVDSERYGARSGYLAGAVPFTISGQHYNELVDDLTRPTKLTEDTVTVNATNERRSGQANTQLNYDLNNYVRQDDGFSDQRGLNQNLSVVDNEGFGRGEWIRLSSLLNYNSISETVIPTDKLLAQESLRLQHTERLQSFYEYAYDFTSSGDASASTHQGRVGLTHQFRDSLTSSADIHGNMTHSASPGDWLDTSRYGAALNEQYTRKLGRWGSLWLAYEGGIDHEERAAAGHLLSIIDELHTLSDTTLTFLNQPLVVVSTIRITDKTQTIVYVQDLDYTVISHGALTEIRRVPGGQISDGGIVLVDYSALLDPSATYSSINNSVSFRLDIAGGLLALYGRWTSLDYCGGEQLHLRWIDDKTVGLESTWRSLRAGAEYEVLDSNLSPYTRMRFFESGHFQLSESAMLSLDCDQSWMDFRDQGTRQTSYGFIVRYQQRFSSALAWNLEGGMRIERGFTFDRDYGTMRTELDWALGKLMVKIGYEFGNESHPTDLMQRHYGYLRIRRSF